jgi:hypothetical protein
MTTKRTKTGDQVTPYDASDPRSVVDPSVPIARPDPSKPYPEEHPIYVPSGDAPTVTALVPNQVILGDPDVTLRVQGTGFDAGTVIVFNGFDEPTTLVSASEVTTGINMAVWGAPAALPVQVRSAAGVLSDALTFTFLAPAEGASTTRRRSH